MKQFLRAMNIERNRSWRYDDDDSSSDEKENVKSDCDQQEQQHETTEAVTKANKRAFNDS
jgi:hypothetical protein